MATSDFGPGRSIFILAVVVGCFAILWPKVFYPMMQAAFTMTKPSGIDDDEKVCCDVMYENKIDFKFFAELCKSVIEREMATDAGIRKHRREKYPPPGMMERCRKKILELCDIDITDALLQTKRGQIAVDYSRRKKYTKSSSNTTNDTSPTTVAAAQSTVAPPSHHLLNLTECLEKHLQFKAPTRRRPARESKLPRHVRQERPPHIGRSVPHPALQEKGNPFPKSYRDRPAMTSPIKPGPMGAMRPSGGPAKTTSSKGGGAMGLVMPIYTVGIIVFFLYTISKILLKRPDDKAPKVMDFHIDPEYHRYITSQEYGNGQPLSYAEYLQQKADCEKIKRGAALLGDAGRKQVFTAIEGIIAEMDEYREKVMTQQSLKEFNVEDDEAADAPQLVPDAEQDGGLQPSAGTVDADGGRVSKENLSDELARITALSSDDAKIAVTGMETQVAFPENKDEPIAEEISNIVLETSVPSDSQLLVAESQCLTHTSTEHIDGWPDLDDLQPVVVTGKMTISLLGKESVEGKRSHRRSLSPHAMANTTEGAVTNSAHGQIEELANALVEDILQQQVPRVLKVNGRSDQRSSASPDIDAFEVVSQNTERRPSPYTRGGPTKQLSRDSLNSQGSSFEYESACQDDDVPPPPAVSSCTPIAEERPLSGLSSGSIELVIAAAANNNNDSNNGFDRARDSNQFQQDRSSSLSFECVSGGSVSPLSPETERTFEKVSPSTLSEELRDAFHGSDLVSGDLDARIAPERRQVSYQSVAQNRHFESADTSELPVSALDSVTVLSDQQQHEEEETEESDSAEMTPEFDDVIRMDEATPTSDGGGGRSNEDFRPDDHC